MARSRLEMLEEEEAQSQAERDRFQELADQYRQQSHLPPGGDQSWREHEAMRRAAYDKGYAPPQNDQARREREAMLFASASEEAGAAAIGDETLEMREPVLRPVPVAKGGQGGTVLIFLLVTAIGLAIAALAYPEMLTAAYWRTPEANPIPPRAAEPPTTPAAEPAAPPVEQPPPVSAPSANLERIPAEPAPPAEAAPPPSVPVIDARPPADAAPAPRPNPKPRAAARDDRNAGGFYAKAPGPDGVLRDTYFPTDPKLDSHMPAREAPAKPGMKGFYAKAPGPDGALEYRFFPSNPPPR